ncbi:hypothetical protein BV25DRAFT_1846837 [Artomyces pyxidatus]|uniref:Uncharacterized protein n=1 Tax=Artomyces pyxidatus TaxID=48021 RepID=A0ACB8TH12_9AGAM|nr:hypothetical protein BV25DRAFT_1846837 [Artomyces pyxidatus]
MFHDLPVALIPLLALAVLQTAAYPNTFHGPLTQRESLSPRLSLAPESLAGRRRQATNSTSPSNPTSSNGTGAGPGTGTSNETDFLWIIQDTFDYTNFFNEFAFYNSGDPTHGTVTYVNQETAFANNLSYISSENTVIMKGDDTTWLQEGEFRQSVRVSSYAQYNTGLFILDTNQAPWGCGVWPAFWTLGNGYWPTTGEIDIIEGVHDNEHNQVTWHTSPGCTLTPTANFTGSIVLQNNQPNLDCTGSATQPGCGITEWSRASYGPTFDAQGGGVFAMKWDQDGIAVWSFYRVAVPQDVKDGTPNPANWGVPVAVLEPGNCDPLTYFQNHSIIFDITFCGDWAGNSYATSGCPGTCADHLMDPTNFVNASWNINWLKVYRRQTVKGVVSGGISVRENLRPWMLLSLLATLSLLCGWFADM